MTAGGCCPNPDNNKTGIDFGNWQPPRKSGMKFNDANNNGQKDPGEVGLDGWDIQLRQGLNVIQTKTTAGGGLYEFVIAAGGTYQVCEVPKAAPWVQTYPNANFPNPVPNGGPPKETVGTVCPGGAYGYEITVQSGDVLTGNDFGNFQKENVPPECQKPTAINAMNLTFPLNAGPDITVQTWKGELVQDAVDSVTDVNLDGYLIIMVIAHADGSLGGTAAQKVVVSKDYTATPATNFPFGLFGCSVTLTGGGTGPAVWVQDTAKGKQILVNGRATNIFVMDLHGGNSAIGVQATACIATCATSTAPTAASASRSSATTTPFTTARARTTPATAFR